MVLTTDKIHQHLILRMGHQNLRGGDQKLSNLQIIPFKLRSGMHPKTKKEISTSVRFSKELSTSLKEEIIHRIMLSRYLHIPDLRNTSKYENSQASEYENSSYSCKLIL